MFSIKKPSANIRMTEDGYTAVPPHFVLPSQERPHGATHDGNHDMLLFCNGNARQDLHVSTGYIASRDISARSSQNVFSSSDPPTCTHRRLSTGCEDKRTYFRSLHFGVSIAHESGFVKGGFENLGFFQDKIEYGCCNFCGIGV